MTAIRVLGLPIMLLALVACEADQPAASAAPESSAEASALAPVLDTMERAEATGALSGARVDELNQKIEQSD